MDLHAFLVGFALTLASGFAHGAMSKLDHLSQLVYQSPALAQQEISQLENQLSAESVPVHSLRLQLLKCHLLNQQGEFQAGVQLAALGLVNSKKYGLDHVAPYFTACAAEGHASSGDLKSSLPLLEKGIAQAKQFQQPQALISLLRLRGQLDIGEENYLQAMEDLRLAMSIAEEAYAQQENWNWPPYSYLLSTMSKLLFKSGDPQQAAQYAKQALKQPDAKGKVRHLLLLNAAYLTHQAGDISSSDRFLQDAKHLLPTSSTAHEQATSYIIIAAIEAEKAILPQAQRLAEESLAIFTQARNRLGVMQANIVLANIHFQAGKPDQGIYHTQEAITSAQQIDQQRVLNQLYLKLGDYYASTGQHQLAYEHLQSAFAAATSANKQLADIRFIQYKTRLSRDLQQSNTESNSSYMLPLDWMLVLVMLGVVIPATCFYLLVSRKQKDLAEASSPSEGAPMHYQLLELAMNNARSSQQPLTILVIGISPTIKDDQPLLEQKIRSKLRELDKLVYLSPQSMMLILPGTQFTGGQQVMEQLIARIEPWQRHAMVSVGVASMQQFDTSTSLVKRALASQASRKKSEDIKLVQATARG